MAHSRFKNGLTSTFTETVKRTYYRAAMVPREMRNDSFTETFKAAALQLARRPSNLAAYEFIFEWGNFVLDR